MATIHAAFCATDAETAFGEVDGIAHFAASAVIRNPFDELGVHASLQNEIFQEPADFIVGKSREHTGLLSEAASQSARDVVFAAAFPYRELSRGADAGFTGIETKQNFA